MKPDTFFWTKCIKNFHFQNYNETFSFFEHPLNAYFLIKKYAIALPHLMEKLKHESVYSEIQEIKNSFNLIAAIDGSSLDQCINGIVMIIHSFDLGKGEKYVRNYFSNA